MTASHQRRRTPARPLLCALALLVGSCARITGCSTPPLAELMESQGSVQRDFASHINGWGGARVGAHFDAGDGLRTGAGASASLELSGGAKVLVESDTTIRFKTARDGAPGRVGLDVASGSATVQSTSNAFEITTEMGVAVLAAGASLRVRHGDHGQRYDVVVGQATFPGREGKTVALGQGQSIEIDIGLAQVLVADEKPAEPAGPAAAATTATPDAGPATATAAGTTPSDSAEAASTGPTEAGLDYADLVLAAGAGAAIYDPHPPTAVGLSLAGV
jgi:hypothetical protein